MTKSEAKDSRRRFLQQSAGAAALLVSAPGALSREVRTGEARTGEDVSPAEDLMREHGVLERVLLVYEEALVRLGPGKDLDPAVLAGSAGIVRRFIEDYHEKLEEREVFPRLEKAGVERALVSVLRAQHRAGRELTDRIRALATREAFRSARERQRLADSIRAFIRMYRPHAAREDTVLFPAFRGVVSPSEYDALGEAFEKEEHRILGDDGFEKVVAEVAGLETRLGIADLAAFTPPAEGTK